MSPESPSDVRFFGLCSNNYQHINSEFRRVARGQVHFRSGGVKTVSPETRNRLGLVDMPRGRGFLSMRDNRLRQVPDASVRVARQTLGRPAHSRRSCRPTPAVPSDRPVSSSPNPRDLSPAAASRPVSAGTALRTRSSAGEHHTETVECLGSNPGESTRTVMIQQQYKSSKPPPSTSMDAGTNLTRSLPASHRAARSNRPEIDGQPRQ